MAAAAAVVVALGGTGWRLLSRSNAASPGSAPEASLVMATVTAAATAAPATEPAPPPRVASEPPPSTAPGATTPLNSDATEFVPGEYVPPPVIVDGQPRVYPLSRNVWVQPKPSSAGSWIGFLWFGNSVRLREPDPIRGSGCNGRWYAIEPRGYVCVDDERATLDPEHPAVRGLTAYAPNLGSPWPHRYGESIDLVRYRSLPSERAQQRNEAYYRGHRARVARARAGEVLDDLLGIDLSDAPSEVLTLPPLPRYLQLDRDRLQRRSTVAWSRQQLHEGRSFLLTSDLKWVPKDRVKTYPPVTFHGVHLGDRARLPLAFFRKHDRPAQRRAKDGCFEPAAETFERLSWVELTGHSESCGGAVYLETRKPGLFVLERDAVVPKLASKTPWGTPLDAAEDPDAPKRGRQTWMETSIMGGWLLAYEGRRPVFATLIAAGRGGPPQGDIEPIETASTPIGRFKITGKIATATMVAPNDLTHSEVPWAQNFSGPHALHAAYWHDGWGELKSGGCVNVSPIDGRWLFTEFTEPKLPEGWHAVRWLNDIEPSTTLLIRR